MAYYIDTTICFTEIKSFISVITCYIRIFYSFHKNQTSINKRNEIILVKFMLQSITTDFFQCIILTTSFIVMKLLVLHFEIYLFYNINSSDFIM